MEQKYLSPSLAAGKKLKTLIKESKWKTQEEFAFQFGADVRTVGRWINQGIANVDTIQELADFLDVEFLSFFS